MLQFYLQELANIDDRRLKLELVFAGKKREYSNAFNYYVAMVGGSHFEDIKDTRNFDERAFKEALRRRTADIYRDLLAIHNSENQVVTGPVNRDFLTVWEQCAPGPLEFRADSRDNGES